MSRPLVVRYLTTNGWKFLSDRKRSGVERRHTGAGSANGYVLTETLDRSIRVTISESSRRR